MRTFVDNSVYLETERLLSRIHVRQQRLVQLVKEEKVPSNEQEKIVLFPKYNHQRKIAAS